MCARESYKQQQVRVAWFCTHFCSSHLSITFSIRVWYHWMQTCCVTISTPEPAAAVAAAGNRDAPASASDKQQQQQQQQQSKAIGVLVVVGLHACSDINSRLFSASWKATAMHRCSIQLLRTLYREDVTSLLPFRPLGSKCAILVPMLLATASSPRSAIYWSCCCCCAAGHTDGCS
jgi:hypothetical protein